MVINRATIPNWMFLLSLREICYLHSRRNLNGMKSSQNLMYVVHEVKLFLIAEEQTPDLSRYGHE